MSKLIFWGSAFFVRQQRSGRTAILKKWLGRLDGVDQHDKMSLWFEGFFVCSPFCFGRASSLQESSKITLCQRVTESPIMSDCLQVSIRLVDSPYRLVAIQRRRPHVYGVKYSALYFTWKYCRKRKIERILSLVAKNYYIILQIKIYLKKLSQIFA